MAVTAHSRSPAHPGAGVPWRRDAPRVRGTFSAPERAKSEKGPAEVGSYVDELLATQTSAGNSDISGYTLCANEWGSFALPGTCDVAYGANGAFAFRSAQSGTITFNNATFGDPISGVAKKGYYRLSGGQRFYAHANHLYSVAALTDAAKNVVERYRYDTYGQRQIVTKGADNTWGTADDGVATASAYGNQIGFTGRYLDKETGLWYFRARYYSGSLGRFVSRDPWRAAKDRIAPLSGDGYPNGLGAYVAYFIPNQSDPSGEIVDWIQDTVDGYESEAQNEMGFADGSKHHCYVACRIGSNYGIMAALAAATFQTFAEHVLTEPSTDWLSDDINNYIGGPCSMLAKTAIFDSLKKSICACCCKALGVSPTG